MEWFTLGIHRLLVADDSSDDATNKHTGAQTRLISQSDVVRYLLEKFPEINSLVSSTVEGEIHIHLFIFFPIRLFCAAAYQESLFLPWMFCCAESGFTDADVPSIGTSRLQPITSSVTALQGFQKLFSDRTSAVPIVDEYVLVCVCSFFVAQFAFSQKN
jgi:hypothetical protein